VSAYEDIDFKLVEIGASEGTHMMAVNKSEVTERFVKLLVDSGFELGEDASIISHLKAKKNEV
jgi:hypothetical protein